MDRSSGDGAGRGLTLADQRMLHRQERLEQVLRHLRRLRRTDEEQHRPPGLELAITDAETELRAIRRELAETAAAGRGITGRGTGDQPRRRASRTA